MKHIHILTIVAGTLALAACEKTADYNDEDVGGAAGATWSAMSQPDSRVVTPSTDETRREPIVDTESD